MRKIVLLFVSAAIAVLLACGVVWADTFQVTNTKDSGRGSLRQAIADANAHSGRDVISFAPGVRGEIGLKSQLPDLRGELEIRGPGAGKLTVRRASDDRFSVFEVERTPNPVTISGLTISDGHDFYGGGVLNKGVLTLRRVVVSDNASWGVYNSGPNQNEPRSKAGTLTVEESVINRNAGSGIRNSLEATASVVRTTVSANNGIGIFNGAEGQVKVEDSTVSNNAEGGIRNSGHGPSADETKLTVRNSTVSENEDQTPGFSGGISNFCATAIVVNSTVTSNENRDAVEDPGGGIDHYEEGCSDGFFYVRGTIVANNESAGGTPDAHGRFRSGGYNLIGDTSGATGFDATDLLNVEPGLDPEGLQFNGGRTKTVALTQDSRAVDAMSEGCPPPVADQRGVSRPQNGDGEGPARCDIGAYELKP